MKTFRYLTGNLFPGLALAGIAVAVLIQNYYDINSPVNPNYYPMKPATYFTLCAITFLVIFLLIGCVAATHRPTTDYVVLIDETDSTFVVPDTAEVFSDIGMDTNIWAGVQFSLARIKDVSYTPHAFIALPKGPNRFAGNQYQRKRELAAFKEKVSALLDSARLDRTGKPNSSVFLPMAGELSRLTNSKADRRVLVLFSDLMENTESVSFYDPKTFALLKSDPDRIRELLFEHAALPDLSDIEVRLIYEPKNAKDDALFEIVSGFYKKLLEDKGASVSISANLTHR